MFVALALNLRSGARVQAFSRFCDMRNQIECTFSMRVLAH